MVLYEEIVNGQESISVIGLGYVGISLAISLAKKVNVIGFDIDSRKINQYQNGIDLTNQVELNEIKNTKALFTSDENKLKDAKFHIIAVPTPIYENNRPNLNCIMEASKVLGRNLKPESIVVYESTVYPGVTEEICIPILERESGLKCGLDFKVGYSPERINPGDKINKLESIVKIVSAIDKDTLEVIAKVYGLIIKAGVCRVESIKIAEAAKVIENVQRDVNIALVNELCILLNELSIDAKSVFEATSTKWNSINFKPGLVGGHCIGVDSYYLIYLADKYGINLDTILTARKINNYIPLYIVENTVKRLLESSKAKEEINVAIFGFSFKENTPDIRNTKVMDIITELERFGIKVKVVDPIVNKEEVLKEYGINIYDETDINSMDGIIFAVAHEDFFKFTLDNIRHMCSGFKNLVLIDIKGIFDRSKAEILDYNYWRL